ncbi:unnamed protein product [Alopecurus aequalis]
MADSTRVDKWRKKPNVQSLATLLNSWPGAHYNISSCKLIFLPSASMGHFVLFSIDKEASCLYVLDPFSVATSPPDSKMTRKHNMELRLLRISIYLNDALAIAQPGWNSEIFSWPRRSFGVPNISSMNLSGYLVFCIMLSWNGTTLVHKIFTDGFKLRKKFLLHLLKYDGNEAQDNIPDIVRQYLNSIKEY